MQPFDLPDNQRRALEALTDGASRATAADLAGVTPRTLHRWMQEPAFILALYQARQTLWLEATSLIHCTAHEAAQALVKGLDDPKPHVRLRAAKLLIDLGTRLLKEERRLVQAMQKASLQPQPQPAAQAGAPSPNADPPTPTAECPTPNAACPTPDAESRLPNADRPTPKSRTFSDMPRRRSPLQRRLLVSERVAQAAASQPASQPAISHQPLAISQSRGSAPGMPAPTAC